MAIAHTAAHGIPEAGERRPSNRRTLGRAEFTRRRYGDSCGCAHALELIGDRWSMLILHQLIHHPARFTNIRKGIPNISANILAKRLREFESLGLVRRSTGPGTEQNYRATAWALEAAPAICGLADWGLRRREHASTKHRPTNYQGSER